MLVSDSLNEPITGEELFALGDVGPCELVEGRIMPTTYTTLDQSTVISGLGAAVFEWTRTNKIGRVAMGDVGVYTRHDPDTVRGADLLFISSERHARKTSPSFLDVAPDLIVEVLSPYDSWSEITQKLREYFTIGVRLVWIADPQIRTVYAYRSITDVRELTENDELPGDDVLPGFSVKVAALFED